MVDLKTLCPLDHLTTARIANAFLFLHGGWVFLAPKKSRAFYGVKELPDPTSTGLIDYLSQRAAMATLTVPFIWWFHIEQGMSLEISVGLSVLPWIVMCLHSILNDMPTEFGFTLRKSNSCSLECFPSWPLRRSRKLRFPTRQSSVWPSGA
jgi:hypothetical protein